MNYQIYCDRGNGPELDGCWGSEHASFATIDEAQAAAKHLASLYPDCAWVVCDDTAAKVSRIPANATDED